MQFRKMTNRENVPDAVVDINNYQQHHDRKYQKLYSHDSRDCLI